MVNSPNNRYPEKRIENLSFDRYSSSLGAIESEHKHIHEGNHFFIADFDTGLSDGDTIEFVVTTPNSNKSTHMTFFIEGTDGVQMEIYEGASGITGGTAQTPLNSNRNSSTSSSLTIVKNPTSISNYGTKIFGMRSGQNKEAGITERNWELILKKNTTYVYKITSNGNSNNISYIGNWYEVEQVD